MKLFAFLLASLFISQASAPALCMTECLFESVASCESTEESSCHSIDKNESCCAAEEAAISTLNETKRIEERGNAELPCTNCGVPCCSVPLCCCYYQDVAELDFSLSVVSAMGQLPCNNGIPVSGYLDECFQPPEII